VERNNTIAVPKAGDTLLFPDGHSDKVQNVFDKMVWRVDPNKPDNISDRPIPIGDFVRSREPNTWVYKGDTDITKAGQ